MPLKLNLVKDQSKDTVSLQIRMPEWLRWELSNIAKDNYRSLNSQIIYMLETAAVQYVMEDKNG